MTDTVSDAMLAEWDAMLKALTPGPWVDRDCIKLILASRTAMPLLIAEVRRLREVGQRLRSACLMARAELEFGGDWETARRVIDAALEGNNA
jgi:hypothetical protein